MDCAQSFRTGPMPSPGTEGARRDSATEAAPAAVWRRVVARLVDLFVVFLLWAVAWILVALPVIQSGGFGLWRRVEEPLLSAVLATTGIGVWFLYTTLFVGWRGQTPGKMLMKVKVVRVGGGRVGYGGAAIRWLAYDAFLYGLVWLFNWADALARTLPPHWLTAKIAALAAGCPVLPWAVWAAYAGSKRGLHDQIAGTRVVAL